MSKSKDPDPFNLNSLIDTTGDININLDDTYGATTTYMADSVYDVSGATDTITISDGTFTITDNATTINIGDWNLSGDFGAISINPSEVERMCKEYPALEKVWRNFKAVYDMVQQDYKGKKEAGEIDDDELPF
jgi:bifunctional ADP-heptose synthase (sugar kinase/adenylyltransferase)